MHAVGLAPTLVRRLLIYSQALLLLSHTCRKSVIIKHDEDRRWRAPDTLRDTLLLRVVRLLDSRKARQFGHPRRHPCPRRSHKVLQLSKNIRSGLLRLLREVGPLL